MVMMFSSLWFKYRNVPVNPIFHFTCQSYSGPMRASEKRLVENERKTAVFTSEEGDTASESITRKLL